MNQLIPQKNNILKILVFLAFVLLPLLATSQVKYEHFLYAGQRDLQSEKYLDAIKKFNTAIYSKPDAFEATWYRQV